MEGHETFEWDIERLKKAVKYRPLQVDASMFWLGDFNECILSSNSKTAMSYEDFDQLFLMDSIIENAHFPNGRW